MAGSNNSISLRIRADIDYRNRILIPAFAAPPTGQPPDRFINLFNVASIRRGATPPEQQACIYNNMRTNNPAGQFRLGGCEAQTNRQLVNTLRTLQDEPINIFFSEREVSGGTIELVLPGIVVLDFDEALFAISLCDIESIQLPVV